MCPKLTRPLRYNCPSDFTRNVRMAEYREGFQSPKLCLTRTADTCINQNQKTLLIQILKNIEKKRFGKRCENPCSLPTVLYQGGVVQPKEIYSDIPVQFFSVSVGRSPSFHHLRGLALTMFIYPVTPLPSQLCLNKMCYILSR